MDKTRAKKIGDRLCRAIEAAGFTDEQLAILVDSPLVDETFRSMVVLALEDLLELEKDPAVLANVKQSVRGVTLDRAIQILGRDNVHGPDDVKDLLGFCPDNVPSIPYTEEDLKKSLEIAAKTGVKEMLVLFVKDDADERPLTGPSLNELVQKKYTEMGLGKFLFDVSWYKNEKFFKEDLGLALEWKLVTKGCIPGSKDKRYDWKEGDSWKKESSQTHAIEQYANSVGVPVDNIKRPPPFAMLYAVALHLVVTERLRGRNNGERLLKYEFYGSNCFFSPENSVRVGLADHSGVCVGGAPRDYWDRYLGVCLLREPYSSVHGP